MNSSENIDSELPSELQENINILRQINFFSSLQLEALKVIAYLCDREAYEPGDELISQAEDGGRAFYILSGGVSLEHTDEGETQILRQYGPETFIGGLILLGKMHSLFTVKAESQTVCLVLAREKFGHVVEQFPDMMPKILKAMVGGVKDWEKELLGADAGRKQFGVSMI